MSTVARLFNGAFAALMGLTICTGTRALAQGNDGRLPPPPLPIPSSQMQAMPAAPMPAPAAEAPPPADLKVEAGPAEDQRRALLGRIMVAKNQGIGISTYMMAFDAIEQQAKSKDSEENILKRVTSLNTSLDDQFKRSAVLKTQRPAPPIAASDPTVPYGSTGSGGGIGKNTDTAALIQKLQNKFGGQIPADLKGKLGNSDPSALMGNPEIMDIIKKYSGK